MWFEVVRLFKSKPKVKLKMSSYLTGLLFVSLHVYCWIMKNYLVIGQLCSHMCLLHNFKWKDNFLVFFYFAFIASITSLLQFLVTIKSTWINFFLSSPGTFKLTLHFSEDYPNKPPTVRFVSRMFHPNSKCLNYHQCSIHIIMTHCLIFPMNSSVYADGSICLDILQNQWSPIYDVAAILTSIQVWQKLCYHWMI